MKLILKLNLFFTKSSTSQDIQFGSFVTFSQISGNINVFGNTISNITGVNGEYNVNVIKTQESLLNAPDFAITNINSYQFVPVFASNGTNTLKSLNFTSNVFKDSISALMSNEWGGFFFTLPGKYKNIFLPSLEKANVKDLKSINIHNYGRGSLIYQQGSIDIDTFTIENYGTDKSFNDTSTFYGAVIHLELENTEVSVLKNIITVGDILARDSFVSVSNSLAMPDEYSPFYNVVVESLTLQNCSSVNAILNLNAKFLNLQINNLKISSNLNSAYGAIYITGGSNITFNNAEFKNNVGNENSDVYVLD